MKNTKGFTLIECILSLGICIFFCLTILPVVVMLTVKADQAEERQRMFEIAYEQIKIIQFNGQIHTPVFKDGGEYVIDFDEENMCVQNQENVQVCISQ
ncbi:competence type IV pilus minor pilin ComGE [Jeotgalibacillus sp. JSM ZJ347]|uniref:competence type IV pilus minor pilin ComGE n=1 Tax=Jeotgalibacillus sp. JSM ZJ347 TaxID=3342117 RepID=UPI0035A99C33